MKISVEVDPQVAAFVRSLAPDPRKRLREGLRGLEQEKGDIKQLEADLAGYTRLRVGGYRVIVRFYGAGSQRTPAASLPSNAPWFTNCSQRFCAAHPVRNNRPICAAYPVDKCSRLW